MSNFWDFSWPVNTLVTHERPHLDELSACLALRRDGTKCFPGIEKSVFAIFDPTIHLDDRTEEEWLEDENTLFVGVRGGRFDDHPHERFPDKCSLTFVLEHLGVCDDPAWLLIEQEVSREDRRGTNVDFHLARLLKYCSRFADVQTTFNHVEFLLGSYLKCQDSYQEALGLVSTAPRKTVNNRQSNTNLTLCWIKGCDNEDFARAARSRREGGGLEAALVIHHNSRGNVYISSNKYLGVCDLSRLAAQLRLAEQSEREGITEKRSEILQADGAGFGWYHQQEAATLLNGSPCHQYIEPSRIPLKTIVKLATDFLTQLSLQTERGARARR